MKMQQKQSTHRLREQELKFLRSVKDLLLSQRLTYGRKNDAFTFKVAISMLVLYLGSLKCNDCNMYANTLQYTVYLCKAVMPHIFTTNQDERCMFD